MFPDDPHACEPVSLDLETFLDSPQLRSVENLQLVMKLFRVPERDSIEDWLAVPWERGHLRTFQRVLDKLNKAKAGRDGPLLKSLTIEDLSDWRTMGRRSTAEIEDCRAQFQKTALDAGVVLQWEWPRDFDSTTPCQVTERGSAIEVEEETRIQAISDGEVTQVTVHQQFLIF